MAGILDGKLASAIYAGFKNKLQTGTLRRAVPSLSGGLDDRGDPFETSAQTWSPNPDQMGRRCSWDRSEPMR